MSVAMLALLAVVAVASRGGHTGGQRESGPSALAWDYALTLWAVVMLLGAALLVYGLVLRRGEEAAQRKNGQALGVFVLFAVLLVLVLAIRLLDDGDGRLLERTPAASIPRVTTVPTTGAGPRAERYEPQFRWWPVGVLAALGLATAVFFVVRGRRTPQTAAGSEELVEELTSILDDTLDDLRAEPDPRRAVIAAYARMERALAAYGVPRRRAEAPLEYLDRVARELPGELAARRLVFELTHLFERAKFSPHAVDAEMKEDAIASLASLRDELRGAAA